MLDYPYLHVVLKIRENFPVTSFQVAVIKVCTRPGQNIRRSSVKMSVEVVLLRQSVS